MARELLSLFYLVDVFRTLGKNFIYSHCYG
jgi:hypothetical protein